MKYAHPCKTKMQNKVRILNDWPFGTHSYSCFTKQHWSCFTAIGTAPRHRINSTSTEQKTDACNKQTHQQPTSHLDDNEKRQQATNVHCILTWTWQSRILNSKRPIDTHYSLVIHWQ